MKASYIDPQIHAQTYAELRAICERFTYAAIVRAVRKVSRDRTGRRRGERERRKDSE